MTFKKVKIIETAPLSLCQRVELLLVYANQKPATNLFVRSENTEKAPRIKNIVRRLKIHYVYAEYEESCNSSSIEIYVSRNKELCMQLFNAMNNYEPITLGRSFGYPETAIQAFLGKRHPFMGDLHDGNPFGYFTQFVFSQEYFKEEVESTSKRWHDTVKKLSPKLYEEIKEYEEIKNSGNHKQHIVWREDGCLFY